MLGIPNRLPKYITVGFKLPDSQDICQGVVVDAFDSDVPEFVKEQYVSKYYEVSEKGNQKDLSAVVKTNSGEFVLIPIRNLTTLTQPCSPTEAKEANLETELQKLYNKIDPELKTNDGEQISELLRELLYTVSLKKRS